MSSNGSPEGNAMTVKDSKELVVVKNSKEHNVGDEGSLEESSSSRRKMISNGSSEGNGVAVKDSKHHDGIDEGSMEMPLKSKK